MTQMSFTEKMMDRGLILLMTLHIILDKLNRKFSKLINILGADRTGYVKRISAAVLALSNKKSLNCKVCQLVKLYKNRKPFKMSKRSGDFISTQDLLNEVNKDSIRL